jgi:phage gp29-like protein
MSDRYLEYPILGMTPASFTNVIQTADLGQISSLMELFEELEDRDGTIAQCIAARKQQVIACGWDVEPFRDYERRKSDEDALPDDAKVANAMRDNFMALPYFENALMHLLGADYMGPSFAEIMWGRGARIDWRVAEIECVPARKFTYYDGETDSTQPRLLTEDEDQYGVPLTPNKWIVHTPMLRGAEPWRSGFGRILVWYYFFKHAKTADWLAFLETHAHPLRLGYFAPEATSATKDAMRNALQYMSTDHWAMLERRQGDDPPFEFMWPQTSEASESFLKLVEYCDKEIRRTILGQVLTTDAGDSNSRGSWALGRIHQSVQQQILTTDAKALMQTVREQLIRPFVRFNFGPEYMDRLPTFRIFHEPPEDLESKARQYGILAQQVQVPISFKHIHATFGTKAPDGEGDTAPPKPDPAPFGGPPAGAAAAKAKRPDGDPGEGAVDDMDTALPITVAAATVQYGATVDAWLKSALGNNAARVGNYLKPRSGFADDEEFAAHVMEWMDKAWLQYWQAGAMDAALIAPYLLTIYKHFKLADDGAWPGGAPGTFTMGDGDERLVSFMNRSDRFFISKMVDHDSYRGPLKKFLIEEYGKSGGKLYGEINAGLIDKFKLAVGKKAHELSKYEVERVIRSTVPRARNWARLEQFVEAGVEYGRVQNGGNPCEFCMDLDGVIISVRRAVSWVEDAMALDDEGFATALQSRTDAHRAAVAAGTPAEEYVNVIGPPGYHSSCECVLVYGG